MCGWLLHYLSMFISHFERIFIGFKCLEKSYVSWNVKTGEILKKSDIVHSAGSKSGRPDIIGIDR